jgi:hypothetical protein
VENTWLGSHQRLNERAGNLQPMIHMGARAYQPALGRFGAATRTITCIRPIRSTASTSMGGRVSQHWYLE